jgi:hypothetical protein
MLSIIETAAMQQKLAFSADQMAQQLKSTGKVILRAARRTAGWIWSSSSDCSLRSGDGV